MKRIKITCDLYGKVIVDDLGNKLFANENDTVQIEISYPNQYASYTKKADIYVDYDKSKHSIEDEVSDNFTFELTNEHLKQGYIKIQPIAYLEDSVQKWDICKLKIRYSINA